MKDESNSFWKKLRAPTLIICEEKLYLIWLVFTIFFGLINIWAGIFLGKNEDVTGAINEGIIYTFSISILSPLLAEIFIKLVVNKKSGKVTEFLAYKITMCAIGFVLVLILAFLWIGKYKGLFILQFIMGIVSIVISFYIYCVLQMDSHMNVVGEYDDNEYLTKEKERMSGIDEEAKKIEKIDSEDGEILL